MAVRRSLLALFAFVSLAATVASVASVAPAAHAQSGVRRPAPTPSPTPAEGQDTESIYTEEVRIPVFAYDNKGRIDQALEIDDVLVVEDDVPQRVKSVRRTPASVLFVLGTGGEINPFMRASTTRDIALGVLQNLRDGDAVAALQFNGRVEVIQDWTREKAQAARALRTKLISRKGSDLSQALTRASELLETQPVGNRHVVLITDGVDTASYNEYQAAIKKLIASQTTLHVISYTAVTRKETAKRDKKQPEVSGAAQSRADIAMVGIDPTLPPGMRRGGGGPSVNGGIWFDPELRRRRREYEQAMNRGEARLKSLADETGGRVLLPLSADEMIANGSDVAREIDAQYVVTYRPKRPLAASSASEYRSIRVGSRRIGLQLRARRGYVVGAMR